MDDINTLPTVIAESNQVGFYHYIQQLSKSATKPLTEKQSIKWNDMVLTSVILGFYKSVQLAARNGHKMAYLCIYEQEALFKNKVPFQPLLLEVFGKLQQGVQPFTLEHISITDTVFALRITWE